MRISKLDNDEIYETVKGTAIGFGFDMIKSSDAAFFNKYGATKIEVSINSKVMEALFNTGGDSATDIAPVYFWFEKLLLKAGNDHLRQGNEARA